jgi:dihydroorotate dehydrogenase (NAD+) catalytic subunit
VRSRLIVNGSGCLDALAAPEVAEQLDAFVTKTITPEPRAGNSPVRIAETEHGMLNSIGLQGPGLDRFLDEVLPALPRPVWVSVGGFDTRDFAESCARLDETDAEVLELNLSCPNVDDAAETAAELVAAARGATSKPLHAKLSPATWDLAETARAVQAAGADGLTLVNTIRGLALDQHTLRPRLGPAVGGYSGPALKPIALAAVWTCFGATGMPIVGMGGITSGYDALEFLAVGARVVGIGTALFADPAAPSRIREELVHELERFGLADASAAVGIAHEGSLPVQTTHLFERAKTAANS